MGFKKNWNMQKVIDDLRHCAVEMNSHYNDGWTQWGCKQDLYRVKFELDRLLKTSPYFSMEQEWLIEQEKQQVWNRLGDKNL